MKILLNRIRLYIENKLDENQYGFIIGMNTTKQINNLKRYLSSGKYRYITSIDIKKAYDSINREILWKLLYKLKISNNIIEILKNYYDKSVGCYRNSMINVNNSVNKNIHYHHYYLIYILIIL